VTGRTATALLWLLTVLLGISVGAGLYEARIMLPVWTATSPDSWINTGTRFWLFVTTGPLTMTVLVSPWFAWRSTAPVRNWWLASLAVAALERVATFAYFIPTMASLQGNSIADTSAVVATLESWSWLNHGRHLLSISAWLLALKALSFTGQPAEPKRPLPR
jgi:hypothetical protein